MSSGPNCSRPKLLGFMKYSPKQYAAAFLEATKDKAVNKEKQVIKNFLNLIFKNGDWQYRRAILSEVEKSFLAKAGIRRVRIESPDPVQAGLKREVKNILDSDIIFSEKIDANLLAGLKILIDDELLIDATGKHAVDSMFVKN